MSTARQRHPVTGVTHPNRDVTPVTGDVSPSIDGHANNHTVAYNYQQGADDSRQTDHVFEAERNNRRHVVNDVAMPNPIRPDLLSGPERVAAICQILAAGFTRLQLRQSRRISIGKAENFLDNKFEESGDQSKPLRKAHQ